jgi:hypothetical protein
LIELSGESEPAVTRSMPAEASCQARAQDAALIIAAWLDTRNADPLGLPVPVAARAKEPQVPARSRDTLVLARPRLSLGAGAFASLDAQGAGAVLSGDVTWLRLAGRFGLRGTLSFPLPREMAVGSGRSRWWRPVLALGLHLPITEGTWALATDAGPALGLLIVSGSGFDHNHVDQALSWGASAGLRLAHQRGRAAYWAELRAWLWPGTQNVREDVRGSAPRLTALPLIEGHLGLGVSFAVF